MNKRHRWEVRFSEEKIGSLLNSRKKIGRLVSVKALSRGVSGRIYKAEFVGTEDSLTVYGELNIRKLLDNLYSSAFVAYREKNEWVFSGMGWGHGVGMSQMGAISLGKKGATSVFFWQDTLRKQKYRKFIRGRSWKKKELC